MKLHTRDFGNEKYIVLYVGPGNEYDRLEYIYDIYEKEWFKEETSVLDEGKAFDLTPSLKRMALKYLLEKGIK